MVKMKEAEFLGALLPSHPDIASIIQAVRENITCPKLAQTMP
jgi:hypothetical protein